MSILDQLIPGGTPGAITAADASLLDRQFKTDEFERRNNATRGVAPTFWDDADAGDEYLVILSDGTREVWEYGTPPTLVQTLEASVFAEWVNSSPAATYGAGEKVFLSQHTVTIDLAEGEDMEYALPEVYPDGTFTINNPHGTFTDDEGVHRHYAHAANCGCVLRGDLSAQ